MNNDLISRSALKKEFNLYFGGVSHAVIAARIIDDAPAVDAVEVVRCRDCKYIYFNKAYNSCLCRNTNGLTSHLKADDFCSYGERREDG